VPSRGIVDVSELYKRAKKVATLYNGTTAPRAVQLDAMKQLQEFFKSLEAAVSQESAKTA